MMKHVVKVFVISEFEVKMVSVDWVNRKVVLVNSTEQPTLLSDEDLSIEFIKEFIENNITKVFDVE